MRSDSDILKELAARSASGTLTANDEFLNEDTTPLSPKAIEQAEARLGFQLPPLLKSIYLKISNGGFGDSYGFLGLVGGPRNEAGMDAVSLYESFREADPDDEHWHWPEGLIPVCHLGCGMYHCLQCGNSDTPVVWFEPNPHEDGESWVDSFVPFCPTFSEYLSAWLDDVDLWAELENE